MDRIVNVAWRRKCSSSCLERVSWEREVWSTGAAATTTTGEAPAVRRLHLAVEPEQQAAEGVVSPPYANRRRLLCSSVSHLRRRR